jgi:hypothetical protein
MMGRTHIITGAAVGAWYAALIPVPYTPAGDLTRVISWGLVTIAATFPDIDHFRGGVSTYFPPFTTLLSWTVRGAPIHLPSRTVRLWPGVRHRDALHRWPQSPLWAAAVGTAVAGIGCGVAALTVPDALWSGWWAWGLAIGVGWATHLLFDARTHSGIPVGNNRHWTLGRTVRTGGRDGGEVRIRVWWFRIAWLSVIGAFVFTQFRLL